MRATRTAEKAKENPMKNKRKPSPLKKIKNQEKARMPKLTKRKIGARQRNSRAKEKTNSALAA